MQRADVWFSAARGASDGVAAGGTWVASVLGWGAIERMQTGAAGFVVTVA